MKWPRGDSASKTFKAGFAFLLKRIFFLTWEYETPYFNEIYGHLIYLLNF